MLPRGVAERTGRRALNLAINGATVEAAEALFRRALAHGARPEAVVLDAYPPLLARPPRHDLDRWASLLGPAGAAELAWTARDPGLFGPVALAALLPSLRSRPSIRAAVAAALRGQGDPRGWGNFVVRRHWALNDGAALKPAPPGGVAVTPATLDPWARRFDPPFRVAPVHVRTIERLLATARDRGVTVYWVLPPLLPALQDRCDASGYADAHRAFVRGWLRRFPNLVVVDAGRSARDPRAFYDPLHLSAEGAYPFSLALGDLVRKTLPPARPGSDRPGPGPWTTLAAFQPRPLPDGVEDLDETVAALTRRHGATAR